MKCTFSSPENSFSNWETETENKIMFKHFALEIPLDSRLSHDNKATTGFSFLCKKCIWGEVYPQNQNFLFNFKILLAPENLNWISYIFQHLFDSFVQSKVGREAYSHYSLSARC